jgi:hypothetical protein
VTRDAAGKALDAAVANVTRALGQEHIKLHLALESARLEHTRLADELYRVRSELESARNVLAAVTKRADLAEARLAAAVRGA